ncbi:AbrB/MazE/SpoVT family DNA-binding domain-containing protein [Sutcliffiella cohnii]
MQATGVVRKTDTLGRIVIPKEVRKNFNINENDGLEIFVENDMIILQKYKPQKECVMTGEISDQNYTVANGKVTLSREGVDLLLKELQKIVSE